jgi:rubrerythrin
MEMRALVNLAAGGAELAPLSWWYKTGKPEGNTLLCLLTVEGEKNFLGQQKHQREPLRWNCFVRVQGGRPTARIVGGTPEERAFFASWLKDAHQKSRTRRAAVAEQRRLEAAYRAKVFSCEHDQEMISTTAEGYSGMYRYKCRKCGHVWEDWRSMGS